VHLLHGAQIRKQRRELHRWMFSTSLFVGSVMEPPEFGAPVARLADSGNSRENCIAGCFQLLYSLAQSMSG
jgi:hypothetical protein